MPYCKRVRTHHSCGHPIDRSAPRQCRACRNLGMRVYRVFHGPTQEEKLKANARSYAGAYLRRGLITKKPCEHCGSAYSQMHHPDYARPLDVRWLCRPCHLALHKAIG